MKQVRIIAWGSLILFMLICFQINTLTALLSPLAGLMIYLYSYLKRKTFFCHFFLGFIHFMGPVMAYASITNSFSTASVMLGGVAFVLITGSDIIYAIQDCTFDRKNSLFSIPACFGIKISLILAACLHALTVLFLVGMGLSGHFSIFYYLIIPVAGWALFYFHTIFHREWNKGSINQLESYFFQCNTYISITVLFFILLFRY